MTTMQAPAFAPEATWVRNLTVGDLITVDPFYGAESIIGITTRTMDQNGIEVAHIQTEWSIPAQRVVQTRFIVKGNHEPVTRWREA